MRSREVELDSHWIASGRALARALVHRIAPLRPRFVRQRRVQRGGVACCTQWPRRGAKRNARCSTGYWTPCARVRVARPCLRRAALPVRRLFQAVRKLCRARPATRVFVGEQRPLTARTFQQHLGPQRVLNPQVIREPISWSSLVASLDNFLRKESGVGIGRLDAEVVETVAGVVRLLRRAAEPLQAEEAGSRSSRQLPALGIDAAANEASSLLPRRARLEGAHASRAESSRVSRIGRALTPSDLCRGCTIPAAEPQGDGRPADLGREHQCRRVSPRQ